MARTTIGGTTYSKKIPGDEGNFMRSVRFDRTGGYIGISEMDDPHDRLLLSPRQLAALIAFATPPAKRSSSLKPAAKKARRVSA